MHDRRSTERRLHVSRPKNRIPQPRPQEGRGWLLPAPRSDSLAQGPALLWSFLCVSKTSIRDRDGVEVVEQGGDAAAIRLVHDRAGAAGGGDDVEAADALLDARDIARRH